MSVTYVAGVTLTVEVAFGNGPLDASPSWTDITSRVRQMDTNSGRQSDLDQYRAGTCTLTLDNRDRNLDPTYTAGPFFGNLKPMRPLRIRATHNAITYDVWYGFIDGWPQDYEPPRDAWVTVEATDAFELLARTPMATSAFAAIVQRDDPALFWQFGELGRVAIDTSGNNHHGNYYKSTGTADVVQSDALVPGVGSRSITLQAPATDESVFARAITADATIISGTANTLEAWVQWFGTGTAGQIILGGTISGVTGGIRLQFGVSGPGIIDLFINNSAGADWIFTNVLIALGAPHHVVVTRNGQDASFYVDGQFKQTVTNAPGAAIVFDPGLFAGGALFSGGTDLLVDDLAVYNSALTGAQVSEHFEQGFLARYNERSGARVGHVLDTIGWPTALRDISSGDTWLDPFDPVSAATLTEIQAIETAEQGRLRIDGAGKVMYRDRSWILANSTAATSQATFGDTAGELPYAVTSLDVSKQLVRNRSRAARATGAVIESKDASSIAAFGELFEDLGTVIVAEDTAVQNLTTWRTDQFAAANPRIPAITVKPRRSPTLLWPQVLGRKIGERITVKRRPQGVGSAIDLQFIIEGVQHRASKDKDWETVWYLAPVPAGGPWFVVGTSDTDSTEQCPY